jgi:hypothetical protein
LIVNADPSGNKFGTEAAGEHCAEVYTETMTTGLAAQVYPADVAEKVQALPLEQIHEVDACTVNEVHDLVTRGASFWAVM